MASSKCSRRAVVKVVVSLFFVFLTLQYLVNVLVYQRFNTAFYNVISGLRNQSFVPRFINLTTAKPGCPFIPPELVGRIQVNIEITSWSYLEESYDWLEPGGRYRPDNCTARNRVAIIVPYRDRDLHLKIFLQNIHPFLRRQQIDYGIYIVEMAAGVKFNRAILMNIGFVEALKAYNYDCFIFHDVDLLPEDDRNLYTCPQMPRHMSSAIDRLQYKLPYSQIFGGVSALTKEHFRKVNGFSNIFFGWGGEDDDMYRRIIYSNLTVTRYSTEVARYKMLVHKKDTGNPQRFSLLQTSRLRRMTDGLSSLKYNRLKLELKKLYTWILVSVNETDVMKSEQMHSSVKSIPVKRNGKIVRKLVYPAMLKPLIAQPSPVKPSPAKLISWVPDGAVAPTHLSIPNELKPHPPVVPKNPPKKNTVQGAKPLVVSAKQTKKHNIPPPVPSNVAKKTPQGQSIRRLNDQNV